jgi:hypothetical protein
MYETGKYPSVPELGTIVFEIKDANILIFNAKTAKKSPESKTFRTFLKKLLLLLRQHLFYFIGGEHFI